MGTESSAEQATAILERMEYIKNHGDGTVAVKPSVHSFAITINAWSNVGSEKAAYNAEEILKRLLQDYDEALQKNIEHAKELQPNNVVFNSIIDAWARSGSNVAGERAEAILHRMEALSRVDKYDVRPDTITFNTCSESSCNDSSFH
jgi:translation initiation factor 2B subunit (eIF-2B alpha/beta/delta family)